MSGKEAGIEQICKWLDSLWCWHDPEDGMTLILGRAEMGSDAWISEGLQPSQE